MAVYYQPSSLTVRASRISDLRRLNDSRCAAAQLGCDTHQSFDELSAALRECSLIRYLNDVGLQAELDDLLNAATTGAPDPPTTSTTSTPLPSAQSEWLGAWASTPRGLACTLSRMPTLRRVLAGLPRLREYGPTPSLGFSKPLTEMSVALAELQLIDAAEPCAQLDGAPLGFSLLQPLQPSACEVVLRLLVSSLFSSGVTPHAAPLVGWRLRRKPPATALAGTPSAATTASGATAASGSQELIVLVERGERLLELLSRPAQPTLAELCERRARCPPFTTPVRPGTSAPLCAPYPRALPCALHECAGGGE